MLDLLLKISQHFVSITIKIFFLGLWLFGFGILTSYLMRWWPGDQFLPVRLTHYLMPWLLLALIPAAIIAMISGRKWLALTLSMPSLFIIITFAPLFLPRSGASFASDTPLKVMSANVWQRNQDLNAFIALVRAQQPDILLLQELKPSHARAISHVLTDLYPETPLSFVYEPTIQQGVMSRYPLSATEVYPELGRAQKVIVESPQGEITVWNVHPRSQIGWLRRYEQISALLTEEIINTDSPLILGGDFNIPDQTEPYRLLSKYLYNAHREAGWGLGLTFPSPEIKLRGRISLPTLVRIDHIFYNDYFLARQASTLSNTGGSDHLPITAELVRIK